MTTLFDQAVPIVNLPFYYINGCILSNDATTPHSVLNLSAGIMRDSTNTYDMNIGNFNGQVNQSASANVSTSINCAVNGLNGLDTGSLGASKIYYIYVVSDPVSGNPSGAIASLAAPSVGPLMPFGYSAFRHVSFAVTDGSSNFLLMYLVGNNNARKLVYDAPQATAVTAGAQTSYTAIDLSAFVPVPSSALVNIPVSIAYAYTPAAASHTLKMQGVLSTGDAVTITGQVAAVIISSNISVLAQLTSSKPEINYKVSNGSDAVAINVAGFDFFI